MDSYVDFSPIYFLNLQAEKDLKSTVNNSTDNKSKIRVDWSVSIDEQLHRICCLISQYTRLFFISVYGSL